MTKGKKKKRAMTLSCSCSYIPVGYTWGGSSQLITVINKNGNEFAKGKVSGHVTHRKPGAVCPKGASRQNSVGYVRPLVAVG